MFQFIIHSFIHPSFHPFKCTSIYLFSILSLFIHPFIYPPFYLLFFHSFTHSLISKSIQTFFHSFFFLSSIRLYIYSSILSSSRPSFNYSPLSVYYPSFILYIYPFIHPFVPLSIISFLYPSFRSFINPFIYQSIFPCFYSCIIIYYPRVIFPI